MLEENQFLKFKILNRVEYFMTLRSKTLITISITIVLLVGILYVSAQKIILNSFKQLEIQNTQQVVKSALNVHNQNVTQLRDRFADWASWDDAYLFVTDSNQAFITSNLTDASLSTLSNNVMIFTDSTEKVVWGTGYNIETGLSEPIPEDIYEKIGKGDLLFYRQTETDLIAGFLMTKAGPMVIASRPILTTENKGPIHGSLLIGYYFNEGRIAKLSEVTQLKIKAVPFDLNLIPEELRATAIDANGENPILVHPVNENEISGYSVINDIYGKPAMIFQVDMPRDLYNQGLLSLNYFMTALIVIGLIIGLVIVFSLERIVLTKLRGLSSDVTKIMNGKENLSRVKVVGKDELSNLAGEINDMISARENAQRELNASQTQLVQAEKMASLGQMVAGLAHEINTPLGYVRSSIETLQEFNLESQTMAQQFKETHNKMMNGDLSDIELIMQRNDQKLNSDALTEGFKTEKILFNSALEGIDRIGDLVNSLKNFSRLDEAAMKEADINDSLDNVLRISNHIIKNLVKVEKNYGVIPQVLCYPAQLNQVFMNLIVNAAHACESKKDLLPDFKGIVKLQTLAKDGMILVRITDNGIGIPEENLTRIFEPFFTTKTVGEGTGLGLSIAYQIIEKHSGKILVESKPGNGTTFTVQIPIEKQSSGTSSLFAED